tara:strand:+ start:95 stop:415 length:321 start_codon:yes stop_codon:yes gene_type:complete
MIHLNLADRVKCNLCDISINLYYRWQYEYALCKLHDKKPPNVRNYGFHLDGEYGIICLNCKDIRLQKEDPNQTILELTRKNYTNKRPKRKKKVKAKKLVIMDTIYE